MVGLMVKEPIPSKMGQFMKANGKMERSKGMVISDMLMEISIRVLLDVD